MGVRTLSDILVNGKLVEWTVLKHQFSLEDSQKRTYSIISKALNMAGLGEKCCSNVCTFNIYCPNSSPLHLVKAKYIYSLLTADSSILDHLNCCWNLTLPHVEWTKILTNLWSRPIEPKITCFLWRFLLNKLPFSKLGGDPNKFSMYN